ncbi:ATPase [Segetibacter sp. 3557_3]|uniref:AAA family ATPase n=1 Tax=Segetibacter sp. 3557_3 TaxID=2547429 RepID=UPI001058CDDE|nr:ATP-binding protein [Segetibacter sp. 3557_3]TDH20630.1 ATPase [Segetibacter sp. 3557_3]
MQAIKKIVVIGPESTGKSTLCKHLADHYNTIWCEEYARAYLLKHGTNYTYDQLLDIAKGQVELEDNCTRKLQERTETSARHKPFLFIDTNMYVMKVWCEFVFGKCHPFILEEIMQRKYDLYLLCNTDLPWVKDELREYPDPETRDKLYRLYLGILENQPVPWIHITGNNSERTAAAINGIDSLFGAI